MASQAAITEHRVFGEITDKSRAISFPIVLATRAKSMGWITSDSSSGNFGRYLRRSGVVRMRDEGIYSGQASSPILRAGTERLKGGSSGGALVAEEVVDVNDFRVNVDGEAVAGHDELRRRARRHKKRPSGCVSRWNTSLRAAPSTNQQAAIDRVKPVPCSQGRPRGFLCARGLGLSLQVLRQHPDGGIQRRRRL